MIHQPISYRREVGFILHDQSFTLVFANGDLNDGPAVEAVLSQPAPRLVIAADGGLRHVLALNLRPDLVIGDMDSADPDMLARAEQNGAQIRRYPVDKDETDLELALRAASEQGGNPIRVIAALGDRLDQTMGNVALLALPALRDRDVRLVGGKQTAWLAYLGETVLKGSPGDTVSLLPAAGSVTGIVTDQLKYPLRNETLSFGPARGISNVMLGEQARVTFDSGILLVIHTMGHA